MRTFTCVCGNPVYFQNSVCQHCGHSLGFLPDQLQIAAIEAVGDGLYRQWQNYRFAQVCNWLKAADESSCCRAFQFNETIPVLSVVVNQARWYRVEEAKRRLLYTLYGLGLPVVGRDRDATRGLCFAFLVDAVAGQKVYTGHDDGLITINVAEADDSRREQIRESLGKRYRTLLGYFRHEIGHYYWDRSIDRSSWLPEFRALFGDERVDVRPPTRRLVAHGAVHQRHQPQPGLARPLSVCARCAGSRQALFHPSGAGAGGAAPRTSPRHQRGRQRGFSAGPFFVLRRVA